jgi:hypothetical protein
MNRSTIKKQMEELIEENIELDKPEHAEYRDQMQRENNRFIAAFTYVLENATDEDIRICQLALPGRVSVLRWAEKRMK